MREAEYQKFEEKKRMIMQSIATEQSPKLWSRVSFAATLLAAILAFGIVGTASAQTAGSTQTGSQPLSLFRNYFVTGDYVVGGVGLRGTGQADGFAHGTI